MTRGKKYWEQATEAARPKPSTPPISKELIARVAHELDLFLASPEGAAAKELLATTNHFIRFVVEDGDGYASVYLLMGTGLVLAGEPTGMWVAYAKETETRTTFRPLTSLQLVSKLAEVGTIPLDSLLDYIRTELDTIADTILKK